MCPQNSQQVVEASDYHLIHTDQLTHDRFSWLAQIHGASVDVLWVCIRQTHQLLLQDANQD